MVLVKVPFCKSLSELANAFLQSTIGAPEVALNSLMRSIVDEKARAVVPMRDTVLASEKTKEENRLTAGRERDNIMVGLFLKKACNELLVDKQRSRQLEPRFSYLHNCHKL